MRVSIYIYICIPGIQEGRSGKVQALFYDKNLLGGGDRKAVQPPLAIKTDLLTPTSAAKNFQVPALPPTPTPPTAGTKPTSPPLVGGTSGVGKADANGDGGGDGGGSGKQSREEGEGGLDDVNWSDDEALDALVDKMAEEVDGKGRAGAVKPYEPCLFWLGDASCHRESASCF